MAINIRRCSSCGTEETEDIFVVAKKDGVSGRRRRGRYSAVVRACGFQSRLEWNPTERAGSGCSTRPAIGARSGKAGLELFCDGLRRPWGVLSEGLDKAASEEESERLEEMCPQTHERRSQDG